MPATTTLALYEEILLLALDDRKGTAAMGSMHTHAVAGAVLAELVLQGALSIGKDKKKLVDAGPGARVADPLLAECLGLVQTAKRRRSARDWVLKFAGLKDLKNRVARGLVQKGVLAEERDKVLGLFPRTIFPARNPGPERELVERLRRAILGDGKVDERTMVTSVIANATGLLAGVVDKKQVKARKTRLQALAEGQAAGAATVEAVQAVQAAVLVASIAATTAATSAAR